ncbi:MAG: cysteine desulfurase-like protein, partial [Mycobacterium sp.]
MAYDVARVRGLHPDLGDGWMRFDSPAGMVVPEAVASAVSTAFRGSTVNIGGPHPAAKRSAVLLEAARRAIADLLNADPAGVVLGADRAVLLSLLADASAIRTGLGSEVVVCRL